MPEPETQELAIVQEAREATERERARRSHLGAEERAHARRADKAAYLREKLGERADAEDRAAAQDG